MESILGLLKTLKIRAQWMEREGWNSEGLIQRAVAGEGVKPVEMGSEMSIDGKIDC